MVRANVFACLCLALGAGVSADDVLSKIVSTGEKAVVNADAGKVVEDAEKAIANANAGKVVAEAEKVAAKAAVTESVAVGTEKKKDTQTAVVVESTPSNEKTTKAVLKAVTDAEEKTETKEDKKATAVVDATMNVLKTESTVEKAVAPQVIAKAKEDAKETFEKFDEAKVGTKASADAAAKVALAEIDGASGKQLNKDVEVNAEKAAVAASKGVADHPNDLAGAVSEAIATVKKEENSTLDLNKTHTGLVAEAVASTEKVVSDVTAGVKAEANAVVEHQSGSVAFPLFLALGVGVYWWMNNVHAQNKVSPYMGALMTLRKEGEEGAKGGAFERKECEFTEYQEFP